MENTKVPVKIDLGDMNYSKIFRVFFTIAVFGINFANGVLRQCSFEVNTDLGRMPLAYTTDSNSRISYIIYPNQQGFFKIDSKKKIVFSCASTRFFSPQFNNYQDVQVTCNGGTQFTYNGNTYDFSKFICQETVHTESRRTNKICGPNNNTIYDVGFKTKNIFFPLYFVCFDEINLYTVYTWYKTRVPNMGNFQNYDRSSFFQVNIYGAIRVDSLYDRAKQQSTIDGILKFNRRTNPYLDNNYLLSKTHLIPRTDLYFAREQIATFNHLNISPIWLRCNMTWREFEKLVRVGMTTNPCNRRVIVTGVYGSFTLPDSQNRPQRLYLAMPQKKVPVSKFVWKIVYDHDDRRNNVVYIIYNNRTASAEKNVQRELNCPSIPCPVNTTNNYANDYINEGLLYCCTIEAFQRVYGQLNSDLFTVGPKVYPPPAA